MDPKAAKPYDPRLPDAMRQVKGRDVEFLLIMNKFKSSDESADPRAVEIVTKLADIAQENGLLSCFTRTPVAGSRRLRTPCGSPKK